MDIKWRNNKIVRTIIVVIVLSLVTAGNLFFFPGIVNQAKMLREKMISEEKSSDALNTYMLELLYYGTHVLYKEAIKAEVKAEVTGNVVGQEEVAIAKGKITEVIKEEIYTEEEIYVAEPELYNYKEEEYINHYYYSNSLDYCVFRPDTNGEYVLGDWNGRRELVAKLEQLQYEQNDSAIEKELQKEYAFYAIVAFDNLGRMSLPKIYDKNFSDEIIETAFMDAEDMVKRQFRNTDTLSFPKNVKVVFAMTEENYLLERDRWWDGASTYHVMNVVSIPIASMLMLAILALLLGHPKPREGKKESLFMRYPIIPIVFGMYLLIGVASGFSVYLNEYEDILRFLESYQNDNYLLGFTLSKEVLELLFYAGFAAFLFGTYFIAYYVVALVRPIFKMGIISYFKEKSILIRILLRVKWHIVKWIEEVKQVHMEDVKKKKIFAILLANFVGLSILACLWFLAIPVLAIYSIFFYVYLLKCYAKVETDYQTMANAAEEIAKGHLEYRMSESMGIYEPMREKLGRVQEGIKRAVKEEVRSQRMKTELISNVSHDLKTPLTAITTYVELLKNPNLTEEERKTYIETLENKSLRLKTLIEDLFEVSKTASHDIVLNKEEVDIVHLLKQAAVEQQEKWEEEGLTIRYQVPEEKVMLFLDGQKTYRIFDNLFGNISKYALPNTRVYVEVIKSEYLVEIVIRNISAAELKVTPEEIMERFVRGDESRNTQGSGLGLAIAKNLVDAQDGNMQIRLDGDLFKVMIHWNV